MESMKYSENLDKDNIYIIEDYVNGVFLEEEIKKRMCFEEKISNRMGKAAL